jgi:hypothetical protein
MRPGYALNTIREWLTPEPERPRTITGNPRTGQGHDGWVIVEETITGHPLRWFCYHGNDVWRWVSNGARAEVFATKDLAQHAADNCSVYYRSQYRIRKRT